MKFAATEKRMSAGQFFGLFPTFNSTLNPPESSKPNDQNHVCQKTETASAVARAFDPAKKFRAEKWQRHF
jgi:hypothetical protein